MQKSCMGIPLLICYVSVAERLVKASGELLLYIALNIEIINVEVHPKKATNCLKYNLILLAVVVVDKTRKRVCISATLIAILSVIFSRPLIFVQDV